MKTHADISNSQLLFPNLCHEIHNLICNLPSYDFSFSSKYLPKNGIYILFENGETGHQDKARCQCDAGHQDRARNQGKRIVRIGTHTGQGRLVSRLFEHFQKENKDRSIFRKNIGRALLARDKDPFLEKWNLKLTSKASREKVLCLTGIKKQNDIEKDVTAYMHEAFSFSIISMPTSDEKERCRLEKFLIQTVSSCKECGASPKWLGQYSPVKSVQRSSLWLTIHTNSLPTPTEQISLDEIKLYISQG